MKMIMILGTMRSFMENKEYIMRIKIKIESGVGFQMHENKINVFKNSSPGCSCDFSIEGEFDSIDIMIGIRNFLDRNKIGYENSSGIWITSHKRTYMNIDIFGEDIIVLDKLEGE